MRYKNHRINPVPSPTEYIFFNHIKKQFLPNNQNNIFFKAMPHRALCIYEQREKMALSSTFSNNMHMYMRFSCGQFDEPGWTEKVKSQNHRHRHGKSQSVIHYITYILHAYEQGLFLFKKEKKTVKIKISKFEGDMDGGLDLDWMMSFNIFCSLLYYTIVIVQLGWLNSSQEFWMELHFEIIINIFRNNFSSLCLYAH